MEYKKVLRFIALIMTMSPFREVSAHKAIYSAQQVKSTIAALDNSMRTLILLDVDDVLITPKSLTFRSSPYNTIIDDIKANCDQYPECEGIISNWRLQRQAMLVDSEWPQVIRELKSQYNVFGLTKVNTGKFGSIQSMEEWRSNELNSLGIEFSSHANLSDVNNPNGPVFFNGIMMTGTESKEKTLKSFSSVLDGVDMIVFVDDREKNLDEIKVFCENHQIGFLGLHFKGLEKLGGQQNEAVYMLQKETLIRDKQWLSDEEASRILKGQRQRI